MHDSHTHVSVRYSNRTYEAVNYGDSKISVSLDSIGVNVHFVPKSTSRCSAKLELGKTVAKRLGLALLQAALEGKSVEFEVEGMEQT